MNKTSGSRVPRILSVLGLLLITGALLLALYNAGESNRAGREAEAVVEALHSVIPSAPSPAEAPIQIPHTGSVSPAEAEEERAEMPEAVSSVSLNGYDYLGILSVPALDLELPVMEDWSESNLKISPCRYSGSAETGGLVIAGHNYRSHFGPLHTLPTGAQILFTAADGAVYDYTVDSVEVLSPWQVREMSGGGWDLTLFTCTASGKARLALRCVSGDRS